jgi:CRP/FNR family cyclic AMP-dependent transcriptional regulator
MMVDQDNIKKVRMADFLMREGDASTELYFVKSGKLEVLFNDVVIGSIGANEVVGEMSFLDEKPRSASVRALEDCELLIIPHDKMLDFEASLPSWYKTLVDTLVTRLRKANELAVI